MRDEWEVLDAEDQPIGLLWEDNPRRALIRRMVAGRLLPQDYDLIIGDTRVAELRQRFNLFRYEMDLDFGIDTNNLLDRRLGIAAGILLAVVEGRQDS
jgi:tetrahydromethanopterin S-methyltransferase subunit F